jgi:tetratricopeptide (TPR) repeat protein
MRLYVGLLAALALIAPAIAQTTAAALERARYQSCLDQVGEDAGAAFEEALSWKIEGGGWPALHCEGRALIALGDDRRGAALLDETRLGLPELDRAATPDLAEDAAAGWLAAEDPDAAIAAAQAGLAADEARPGLWRLLAEAARSSEHWALAETATTRLIRMDEETAAAWRDRAEARLEIGDLDGARSDIDTALALDGEDIRTLVLRGRIVEARRLRG